MGRRRARGRAVDGIVLLDKPVGMTSNAALQTVKRLFRARKAGHTGSLDPMASGLLPLCLGEATKMSPFLLEADKRYRFTVRLGERTTTGDAEGEVVERCPIPALDRKAVERVLERFRGTVEQIPPMHSAIKHQGQPLYKLAFRGVEVERRPRTVTIHRLELIRLGEGELELDVTCSKGTYIRTLAEDIGAALGSCGHVSALRRTGVGPFGDERAVPLAELRRVAEEGGAEALDRYLLPMEEALRHWPEVQLTPDLAFYVRQGQPVFVPRAPTEGWVRLRSGDRFLGVGRILDDGRVAPKRLVEA